MEINRDYPCNPANYQGRRARPVSYLVIHYVGALGGAKNNAVWYHRDEPKISAHYFVGHASEGAAVYGSVPEDCVASHCGRSDGKYVHPECRNANSIGIELCCHQDKAGKWYFDPETVDRTVELTRMLMGKYHVDVSHVVRHYDVTGKVCPRPFVDDLNAWVNFKKRLVEDTMTQDDFNAMFSVAMGNYITNMTALPTSTWAQESWDKATKSDVLDGNRPACNVTREQLATVLDRLKLLN